MTSAMVVAEEDGAAVISPRRIRIERRTAAGPRGEVIRPALESSPAFVIGLADGTEGHSAPLG
jgi:hypothetical protein